MSEDDEGALVGAIAEGGGEALEQGLVASVDGVEGGESVGFLLESVLSGGVKQGVDGGVVHVCEWGGAAAEACFCLSFRLSACGEHVGQQVELGDILVLAGAGEKLVGGLVEEDVEDDMVVVGVAAVAVSFPIADVRVEFDVAVEGLAVDLDAGLGEVGAGGVVPGAEVLDVDGVALGAGEVVAELACEPEALEV